MKRRGLSATSFSPSTTSANRPTTSAGGYYGQDENYPYSNEYSFDDEEESEEEDVFAFGPPSTADQQRPDQPILQSSNSHTHGHAVHVAFPEPVHDPRHDYPQGSPQAGPSNSPSALALHNSHHRIPPLPRVDTPPSTDSQCTDDPYRLRRVVSANSSTNEAALRSSYLGRKGDSQQLPFSLPTSNEKRQEEEMFDLTGKESTLRTSQSLIDEESREESIKMGFDLDAVNEDEDSPYPEVRASVSNIDDPEMPTTTIRMWFIGIFLCTISSALNMYYYFRQPAPSIVPLVLVLVSYPMGKFLAFLLPISVYRLPRWLGGFEFSFNPGPWNIKEHTLVYIMANVAISTPYATNGIVVAEVYYKIKYGFWFELTFILATQLTGFSLAGLCRRFLVWPASMVWPQNLVVCTLLNTLHAEEDEGNTGVSRYRYFIWLFCGTLVFYFLPGFLFTGLSVFSWMCWIAPNNVPLNQLFGVYSGLGMGIVTFDWSQITWFGSPLMIPWWAEIQIFLGFVFFFWIMTPILYYTDTWHMSHFPINADSPYDRNGSVYDILRVLTINDTFDMQAFDSYSPLYLPATYAVTYLVAFALISCVLVHTILYYGPSILNGLKKTRVEADDIHAKLMRNYPEVPDWWYLAFFLVFFSLAIISMEVWDTGVPIWALLLSVLIPTVYMLPAGFIYAMTAQGVTINLLAQVVPGSLLPGKPMANIVFKGYALQTLAQGNNFVQDLKLGHYIKIPPRATFMTQLISTFLAAFVQVGVKTWMFENIPDICTRTQKSSLTCPHNQVSFTASAVWGLIGPSRQFGPNSIYHPEVFAVIIGAFLPIPFWLWQRRRPKSWVAYINTPVILVGCLYIPPATGINYSAWFAVGFVFQYVIRRRNFLWWSKFNYVTSAALDSGTVISLVFIFLTLQFPDGGRITLNWWGNNVWRNTADYRMTPINPTPL